MISLSVDRTALALSALVFDDPDAGFWIPEDGISYPEKRWRREYVSSRNLHGEILVRAKLENATIAATLYVRAADAASLKAAKTAVEDAFGQFFYNVTVTEDGESVTYNADPADIDWGRADSGMTRGHLLSASVSIPVYPIASA